MRGADAMHGRAAHAGRSPLPPELAEKVASHRAWYHTLELAPGVETPGWFDLRRVPERVGFPEDLSGRRCLDVATFDGFWAFEMEARGAAEVVAIDVLDPRAWDWPARPAPGALEALGSRQAGGLGFLLAKEALGSSVERLERSVYDLRAEELGRFDFVYVGSVLLHLRDPVRALERVASVCRGEVLLVDAVSPAWSLLRHTPLATLDGLGRPWWWRPNLAGLERMVEAAGLRPCGRARLVVLPAGKGQPPLSRAALSLSVLRHKEGREALVRRVLGDPHGALRARPA